MPKPLLTIGLMDLADNLAKELDQTKVNARKAVRAMFDEILATAQAGGVVKIRDFGTFQYRARQARTGRNPRTGEPVAVAPSRSLAFRASKSAKEAAAKSTPAKKSSKAK